MVPVKGMALSVTRIELKNSFDLQKVREGGLTESEVRSVAVEALVDTGATMLVLPADVVERLGVPVSSWRNLRYADGRLAKLPCVTGSGSRSSGGA